jgi:hypothetical protein
MMQLPSMRPAKGQLTSVFSENLAVGPDFCVAPEIMVNLVDVVEIGSENL